MVWKMLLSQVLKKTSMKMALRKQSETSIYATTLDLYRYEELPLEEEYANKLYAMQECHLIPALNDFKDFLQVGKRHRLRRGK